MDWTIVQDALCKRGAGSEWASGLCLAAEQSIEVGSRNMDWAFVQGGLCWDMFKVGKWASLAAAQSIGRSQEAWIGRFYKVDFVVEGHVHSGQVGFPLLLNKTRKWVEKFGSATIHVVCGLAQPSYFMGHILEEPHEHADLKISGFTPTCGFMPTARRLGGNGCYAFGRWEAPPPVYKQPIGAA